VRLSEVLCQDGPIGRLQRAFAAGRLAHAYVFAGPHGVGRRTTAEAWARMLVCRDRVAGADGFVDSCGRCEGCRQFDAGSHPDVQVVRKELRPYTKKDAGKEAKQDLSIHVIREFLIERAGRGPQAADHVVFIVYEAERLNISSQNALLKVLEEPPEPCLIILLCSRLEKLAATILSRCQVLGFGPVDEGVIVDRLSARGLGPEEAAFWARFCEGSLGEALDWAALEIGGRRAYAVYGELVDRLAGFDLSQLAVLSGELEGWAKSLAAAWAQRDPEAGSTDVHRRAVKGLLRMIQWVFREAMILAAGGREVPQSGGAAGGVLPGVRRLAERMDVEALAEIVACAGQRMAWVEASVNERLIWEELLFRIGGHVIVLGLS